MNENCQNAILNFKSLQEINQLSILNIVIRIVHVKMIFNWLLLSFIFRKDVIFTISLFN